MTNAVNIAQSGSNNQTFRNKLINGAMAIAQRGTSFTGITISNSRAYPADRFLVYNGDPTSVLSAAQISDAPAGFVNSIRAQVTTINATPSGETYIEQIIEGTNCIGLAYGTSDAKSATLSFWIKVSIAGVYNVWMYSESATKSIGSSFTVSSANTWQFVSLTFVGDTASALASGNGPGIYVRWYLDIANGGIGALSSTWSSNNGPRMVPGSVRLTSTLNATYQITGAQFEIGTAASPFENRLYGTELALCQRYFTRLGGVANYTMFGTGMFRNSTTGNIIAVLPVQMRTTPTVTFSAASNFFVSQGSSNVTPSAINIDQPSPLSLMIDATTSATTTGNATRIFAANTTAAVIDSSAEL